MDAWLAWTAVLVLAYFSLLTWSLKRRGPGLQGPWFFFLRAFFPNWKFFHGVGRAPRLYVRAQTGPQSWSDWQLVYPRQPRRLSHLLHNPVVNLALTQQNLVDHLAQDINDLPEGADLSQCVSFSLVRRLAHDAVCGGCWGPVPLTTPALMPTQAWQFELRMERPELPGQSADSALMLRSAVMPMTPTPPQN
jgi:hypothetical protein